MRGCIVGTWEVGKMGQQDVRVRVPGVWGDAQQPSDTGVEDVVG